jgi:hypothetical protein
MKNLIRLEEAAQFILVIFALHLQPIPLSWWLWPIAFLAPDLGMLGYLINTTAGAFTYNLLHHKLVAIAVLVTGYCLQQPVLILAGLVMFGHSSFDRMLGYGLKYNDSFKHTHLGWLKNGKEEQVAG